MAKPPHNVQWSHLPHALADLLHAVPDDHPVHIALRTYALSLSLSLGPALLPLIASPKARSRGGVQALKNILRRELGIAGFAFAMTVAVGGSAALKRLWDKWDRRREEDASPDAVYRSGRGKLRTWVASLKDSHRTFISSLLSACLAITLLHSRRRRTPSVGTSIPMTLPLSNGRPSATLDLTLVFLVRAVDSMIRSTLLPSVPNVGGQVTAEVKEDVMKQRQRLTTRFDALVFWACSARIMWCFCYEPERLPRSYNKWIMSLANIDPRILHALRAIRTGQFSYTKRFSNPPDLVSGFARDLGYPASWGDPTLLPPYGGPQADAAWKVLGVHNRKGVGGLPCELVHGAVTNGSCTANAGIRGAQAFVEALAIYLPVHVLPILLSRPRHLLESQTLLRTMLSLIRSATFLSTFVSSVFTAVCLTRTLFLARLLPFVSHDFWDGPFGCAFVGSLVCGASIWIEEGKRRGEMALYVLPRAVRACLPERWLSNGRSVRVIERLTFVLSLATLLTAYSHRSDSLRGLSRWTLAFVMKGPNAGFWKRKSQCAFHGPVPPAEDTLPPPANTDDIIQN